MEYFNEVQEIRREFNCSPYNYFSEKLGGTIFTTSAIKTLRYFESLGKLTEVYNPVLIRGEFDTWVHVYTKQGDRIFQVLGPLLGHSSSNP